MALTLEGGEVVLLVLGAVVLVLATLILVTAAMIHCDNPGSARIAMSLFVVAAASSVVLIASHNRPFTGQLSVSPDLLVQVMPPKE